MNINEIKAQEARKSEKDYLFKRLEQFSSGELYPGSENGLRSDIETLIEDYKLQDQYVKHLEQDKENMKKIINILCDTISQLI